MFEVDAENLVANYFSRCDEKSISFSQLKKIKKSLEERTSFEIYADISDSLDEIDPEVGEVDFDDCCIRRGLKMDKTNSYEIDKEYNWQLPDDIRETYHEVLEEITN